MVEVDIPELSYEFLKTPRFVKSFLTSVAFSYGMFCLSACLLMRKQKPVYRGYFVSVPAFFATFAYTLTRPPLVFPASAVMEYVGILKKLKAQVVELQKTLDSVDATGFLTGDFISSLLSEDPNWMSLFKTHFENINSFLSDDCKFACQLLILGTLLSFQREFKLISSFDWFLCSVAAMSCSEDVDCTIWMRNLVFALIKCKEDRPRNILPQLESAGFTFSDQLELEASGGPNTPTTPEEWTMSGKESESIIHRIFSKNEKFCNFLVKLKATDTIACLCRIPSLRPLIIQANGVDVLLKTSDKKDEQKVALARLCMSTSPHVWKYSESISLSLACFELIETNNFELYKFEASIGLINVLTLEEVITFIANKSISIFFDLITNSIDSRLVRSGTQIICNLSVSELFVQRILSSEKYLQILTFLLKSSEDQDTRMAAGGALAMLANNEQVAEKLNPDEFFPLLETPNFLTTRVVVILVGIARVRPEIQPKLRERIDGFPNCNELTQIFENVVPNK